MRVLVCGSRKWPYKGLIRRTLYQVQPSEIIHGGAAGADTMAGDIGEEMNIKVTRVPADWSRGSGAGFERNLKMLAMKPEMVLAFHLNKSPGTAHTIREARRQGIPVRVIEPSDAAQAP